MRIARIICAILILAAPLAACGGAARAQGITITVTSGSGTNEGVQSESWGWVTKEALIFIVKANGTIHPTALNPPYYLSGGDEFIASIEVGYGFPFQSDGRLAFDVAVEKGSYIYARAFNNNTILGSTFYGDSGLFFIYATMETSDSWNIGGSDNVPAFRTDTVLNLTSPGPPYNFSATQDASGDLILTWTNTTDADLAYVEIRYRTDGVFPTRETDGALVIKKSVTPGSFSSQIHSGLLNGTTHRYSAFSIDTANNYSTDYATAFATSQDILQPHVISNSHPESVPVMTVSVQFSEPMDHDSATAEFRISPSPSSKVFSWNGNWMRIDVGGMQFNTTYRCTEEVGARDLAGNNLSSTYEFSFTTPSAPADITPPVISSFRINGRMVFNGDIISPRPRVSATITDEGGVGIISSIELWANDQLKYSGAPGPAFNPATGTFEYTLVSAQSLAAGRYEIRIVAWDMGLNITEEGRSGLRVSRDVGIDGPVLNYPNPFSPLKKKQGTTIAYNCKSDFEVTLYIYDITGHLIWRRGFPAGSEGGHAGYNEVYWSGRTSFGEYAGNGIYVLKLVSGKKVLSTSKLTVLD